MTPLQVAVTSGGHVEAPAGEIDARSVVGEEGGVEVASTPLRYCEAMPSRVASVTNGSTSRRVSSVSPVPARSVQADNGIAASGMGTPASRAASIVTSVSPPPAESPAMKVDVASPAPLGPFSRRKR